MAGGPPEWQEAYGPSASEDGGLAGAVLHAAEAAVGAVRAAQRTSTAAVREVAGLPDSAYVAEGEDEEGDEGEGHGVRPGGEGGVSAVVVRGAQQQQRQQAVAQHNVVPSPITDLAAYKERLRALQARLLTQ